MSAVYNYLFITSTIMIDKGKYASHGVFIKKIDENFVGNWGKPKNAVIHPIPTTKPR